MKTGRNIIKNFTSLMIADFAVKGIGFVVTVYLARKFNPYDFGILSFSLSIINYFAFLADPGLSTYGVKQVVKDPAGIPSHLNDISMVRAYMAGITIAIVAAMTAVMKQPPIVQTLVLTYALTLLPQAVNSTWIYLGLQKMEFSALYAVAQSLVYAGLILTLVKTHSDITFVPLALVGAYLVPAACLLWLTVRTYGYKFRRLTFSEVRGTLKESLPIGVGYFIICGVNWNLSTSLLGFFSEQSEVGYFSIAFRICLIMMGGGVAFSAALFPAFAQYITASKETAGKILRLAEKTTLIAAWPLLAGTVVTADALILGIFGVKYLASGVLLKTLMAGALFYVLNMIYNMYLIADEKHVKNMHISVIRTVLLVVSSVVLIKKYGALGAAIAYTFTEFLTFLIYVAAIKPVSERRILFLSFKPFIASMGMCLVLYFFSSVAVGSKIIIGVTSYSVLLLAVGGVRMDEIRKLAEYVKKRGG